MRTLTDFEEKLLAHLQISKDPEHILAFSNVYWGMDYHLSRVMPDDYALANGLTQQEERTIYINPDFAEASELLFYFIGVLSKRRFP